MHRAHSLQHVVESGTSPSEYLDQLFRLHEERYLGAHTYARSRAVLQKISRSQCRNPYGRILAGKTWLFTKAASIYTSVSQRGPYRVPYTLDKTFLKNVTFAVQ